MLSAVCPGSVFQNSPVSVAAELLEMSVWSLSGCSTERSAAVYCDFVSVGSTTSSSALPAGTACTAVPSAPLRLSLSQIRNESSDSQEQGPVISFLLSRTRVPNTEGSAAELHGRPQTGS